MIVLCLRGPRDRSGYSKFMKLAECSPELQKIIETLEIGDEYFWEPLRLALPGAWTGHLATAFWLAKVVKPRILVELGTHSGNSYSAFCQAISRLELPSRAFAVDTWKGDEHAGFYDESVFQELDVFNQNYFGRFSRLVRSTFDEARQYFADGSIDLLHIDGLHTYDAVRHDFEIWRTATSPSAVIVFHDINVRKDEFGVWRLWQELSEGYPSFEFHHSEGLGVLGLGPDQSPALTRLFELGRDTQAAFAVRQLFAARGEAFLNLARCLELEHQKAADVESIRQQKAHVQANIDAIQPELERLRALEAKVKEDGPAIQKALNDASRVEAAARAEAAEYKRANDAAEQQVQHLRNDLDSAHKVLASARDQASSMQTRLQMSESIARQQSLTIQRNLLDLQSARQEIEGYKQELENYKQDLKNHKEAIENYRHELDNHKRALYDKERDLDGYKTAYAQAAGLLIPLRIRRSVPDPLKPPLRAVKRAFRSLLRRSP